MATKIEVLNKGEYGQYIMIAMIQTARNILEESPAIPLHAERVKAARQILQNPQAKIDVFKSLVVVSFDTSTYDALTEAVKISGAVTLVANVFNEATFIYSE